MHLDSAHHFRGMSKWSRGARSRTSSRFWIASSRSFIVAVKRWYMVGAIPYDPWTTQGYQSEHTPAALGAMGGALDAHCSATHDGRDFVDLSDRRTGTRSRAIDDGEIEFEGVSRQAFFRISPK